MLKTNAAFPPSDVLCGPQNSTIVPFVYLCRPVVIWKLVLSLTSEDDAVGGCHGVQHQITDA